MRSFFPADGLHLANRYQQRAWFPHDLGERLFAIIAMMVTTAAFIPLFQSGGGDALSTLSSGQYVAFMVVFSLSLFLLALRANSVLAIFKENPILVVFLGLLIISSIWAMFPKPTFLSAVSAILTASLGIYLVTRFPDREFFILLSQMFLIIAVCSLIIAVVLPKYGAHNFTGSWRGVYINRNALATYTALAMTIAILMLILHPRQKLINLMLLGIAAFLYYKTGSKTSLIAMMLSGFYAYYVGVIYRSSTATGVFISACLFFIFGGSFLMLVFFLEEFFMLIGRDMNFSGRTDIWEQGIELVSDAPFIGYGNLPGDIMPAAHNMWLTLMLKGGLLLTLTFLALYITAFYRCAYYSRFLEGPSRYFFNFFMMFNFIRGLTESLYFTNLLWVFLITCILGPKFYVTSARMRKNLENAKLS